VSYWLSAGIKLTAQTHTPVLDISRLFVIEPNFPKTMAVGTEFVGKYAV
jgi:hypothetical protein